jgi:hypothetical protein
MCTNLFLQRFIRRQTNILIKIIIVVRIIIIIRNRSTNKCPRAARPFLHDRKQMVNKASMLLCWHIIQRGAGRMMIQTKTNCHPQPTLALSHWMMGIARQILSALQCIDYRLIVIF